MQLEIKLFAVARQRLGRPTIAVALPDGATVGDLRSTLIASTPEISEIVGNLMIAVDSEYADDSRVLRPESEVALIPPVSGG